MFCPCPDGLVVNMKAHTNAVDEFLKLLPTYFDKTTDTHLALGAAIQIAHLLIVGCRRCTDGHIYYCCRRITVAASQS
jgi:hypothetical protein